MSALPLPTAAKDHPIDTTVVTALQSGQDFVCLLEDDPARRSTALEGLIDSVADLRTRFVRIGNPLRAPLTIERLLIQAAGSDAESYYDRTAEEFTRILTRPRHNETRVILVVEQADTLDSEALRVLRDMAPFFAAAIPRLQILFAGQRSFQAMLDAKPPPPPLPAAEPPEAAPVVAPPLPQAAVPVETPAPVPITTVPTMAAPAMAEASLPAHSVLPPAPTLSPGVAPPKRRGGIWRVLLLVVVVVMVLAGIAAAILWIIYPDQAAELLQRVLRKIALWRAMIMPSPSPT